MKKIKILELTNFSAGGCGVFARVKREAALLKKAGFEVKIFSSNLEKGTNKVMPEKDSFEEVEIQRFPTKKLGGESFMRWHFENAAIKYSPDVILAHVYRHPHTLSALEVAKKTKSKVFLVTHASFDRDSSRGLISKLSVKIFDKLIGKRIINKYDKIISITKWELPYLYSLGVQKQRIFYLPNGLPSEYFKKQTKKEKNKILFLGRISPIKDIATLIKSIPLLKDKTTTLEIYGPAEEAYLEELQNLIMKLKLKNRVSITNKTYISKEEIEILDSSRIFVLPSISEGMPQVLIEALSREKIIIASNNKGNSDIIEHEKNGFLFETQNSKDLAEKIDYALSLNKTQVLKIKENALKTAEKFKWENLIKELISLIQKA